MKTNSEQNWFEVDKDGMAKILARKGKEFILYELLQNAWDADGVTDVIISVASHGRGRATLRIEDNAPDGFSQLSHAFTLFAESSRKADPIKRGRFNLGEKLVLAVSKRVTIITTKGGLLFDANGRHTLRQRRSEGSFIECDLCLTKSEVDDLCNKARTVVVPEGVTTIFNNERLLHRMPVATQLVTLPTEIADAKGYLRRSNRSTRVTFFNVLPGETAMLYELGIPVMATGDRWHYNVEQKIPQSLDRDSVAPAYLNQVRAAALCALYGHMTPDDANSDWVAAAIATGKCTDPVVEAYMTKRFGHKRVAYDPSDVEANKRAVSAGYTIVHGGMLSAGAWTAAKAAESIKPAGQVTPSDKVWNGQDDPDAETFTDWIPTDKWTKGMCEIATFASRVAVLTINKNIDVRFCSSVHHLAAASYGPGCGLVFNKLRLGNDWFERGITVDVVDLVIHELAHEYSGDHLSAEYYDALTRIGAKMFLLAKAGKL